MYQWEALRKVKNLDKLIITVSFMTGFSVGLFVMNILNWYFTDDVRRFLQLVGEIMG